MKQKKNKVKAKKKSEVLFRRNDVTSGKVNVRLDIRQNFFKKKKIMTSKLCAAIITNWRAKYQT